MTFNPQRKPYPDEWVANVMKIIDAIVDGDQVTDKDFVEALIAALPDPLQYKGVWNANTNTPTLLNTDTDVTGFVYRCNVAGSTDFGAGSITFTVGDFAVNNGTIWEKWDAGDVVSSVFTRVGNVVAQSGDYTHAQIGSQTADDHHRENTQARSQAILHTSWVRGSDSAPNDGTDDNPFKTINHAISIGGDGCVIYTDGSAPGGFPSTQENVTIPAGYSIHIISMIAPLEEPSIGAAEIGTLTMMDGCKLVMDNVDMSVLFVDGGATSVNAYVENGSIADVSNADKLTIRLYGPSLAPNARTAIAGNFAGRGWGFETTSGLIYLFSSSSGAVAMNLNFHVIEQSGDPVNPTDVDNKQSRDAAIFAQSLAEGWLEPVLDKDLTTPAGGESAGDRFIVATPATGDWTGEDGNIATALINNPSLPGEWRFDTPSEGYVLTVLDENAVYYYDNAGSWVFWQIAHPPKVIQDSEEGPDGTNNATPQLAFQSVQALETASYIVMMQAEFQGQGLGVNRIVGSLEYDDGGGNVILASINLTTNTYCVRTSIFVLSATAGNYDFDFFFSKPSGAGASVNIRRKRLVIMKVVE